jgi:hypothetical protein
LEAPDLADIDFDPPGERAQMIAAISPSIRVRWRAVSANFDAIFGGMAFFPALSSEAATRSASALT